MTSQPGEGGPELLEGVARLVSDHIRARRSQPVASPVDAGRLGARLAAYDFGEPRAGLAVAADLFDLLSANTVRSDHPAYFGLFNPPALIPAIAGDLIAAAVNPQLAVWSHAPAAAEIERKLVDLFSATIWSGQASAGTFTSGGSEANHTAVLAALARRYPAWSSEGLPLGKRPLIFVSAEAHLAWIKIARSVGLGDQAVRLVPPANGLSLSGTTLREAISAASAFEPLIVVATAGATAHGAIDDLRGIAEAGREIGAYVHVDAAWAGGALLDPARRVLFDGIEDADSVTIDPHKWLAVPMGAGLFLARTWEGLAAAFGVSTGYMPASTDAHRDAYVHSMQWSRRFIGAKLFMALATLGLDGYRSMIARQFALGDRLRHGLEAQGWAVLNDTALPLVCFAPSGGGDDAVRDIEAAVVQTGGAWISSVRLKGRLALRACVTSFETTETDIDELIRLVGDARAAAQR